MYSSKTATIYKGENGVCAKGENINIIPYDEANKIYKNMYGEDMPKKGFTTYEISSLYYHNYDYNDSLNSFVELKCGACGGICTYGGNTVHINKIKSAYTIGDNLIIDVYYLNANNLTESNSKLKLISFSTKTHKDVTIDAEDLEGAKKEIEEKHLDKLDVYEVVFTKKDGNYIFKSLSSKTGE